MINPDELHALVDALPEDSRGKAQVFLLGLVQGRDDVDGELDAIVGDPARFERLKAAIEVGWQQAERGEGLPLGDAFADVRRRTQPHRDRG